MFLSFGAIQMHGLPFDLTVTHWSSFQMPAIATGSWFNARHCSDWLGNNVAANWTCFDSPTQSIAVAFPVLRSSSPSLQTAPDRSSSPWASSPMRVYSSIDHWLAIWGWHSLRWGAYCTCLPTADGTPSPRAAADNDHTRPPCLLLPFSGAGLPRSCLSSCPHTGWSPCQTIALLWCTPYSTN